MTRFLGSPVKGGDDVGRECRAAFGVSTVVVAPTERIDRERAERTRNDQGRVAKSHFTSHRAVFASASMRLGGQLAAGVPLL